MIIPKNLILPFTGYHHTIDPIIIEKGIGAYVFDQSGKSYFDGNSSLWCCSLGHNHPLISEALKKQIDKIAHSSLFGQAHSAVVTLVPKLLNFSKLDDYSVFFSNSGSEAVEAALKITYSYHLRLEGKNTKRRKFLTFVNSYHGETSAAMSVSGFDSHKIDYQPLLFDFIKCESGLKTVDQRLSESKEIEAFDSFENMIELHHQSLIAVIVEPLFGAGGILIPEPSYLKNISSLCKKYGVLLIYDEVATGFYRSGPKFAFNELDIKPDVVVLGKALSSGYSPLSATIVSSAIADCYDRRLENEPFYHGHTHSGNPLGCTAAAVTIDILESSSFLDKLAELSNFFDNKINELNHPLIAEKRYKGIITGIELHSNSYHESGCSIALNVCNLCKREGLILRNLGNTIVIAPPLISSQSDISFCFDVLALALNRIENCFL
jgi:adenosylmethionine---8-amino-7-oxononanoate aminotransferase